MTGQATNEGDDFIARLVQDHARIEERLKALDLAAEAVSRVESDTAALAVIADTLAFFAAEGARHEAHEELTLFPRLRSRPDFKQIVSALRFQHRMNDAAAQELSACVARFGPGRGRELRRLAVRFAELQRAHAFAEEHSLFPLLASALPPGLVAEMGREIRERNAAANPTGEATR